jgi:hypothetical protein
MNDYLEIPVTEDEEDYWKFLIRQIELARKLKEEKEEFNDLFKSGD